MKLRILLADDHALFREALRMVLELEPDIEVVGEAQGGLQVLQAIALAQPDVVCMDVNMPGLNGVETTRELRRLHPEARVVGLSAHVDLARVAEMLDAGALGYVIKGSAGSELMAAIRAASRNETYLSPDLGLADVTDLAAYRPTHKFITNESTAPIK